MSKARHSERGAALVTVLSMVSIMAALAIVVVDAGKMSIQRTLNLTSMEQSRWYLLGAEAYAAGRIGELQRADTQIDQGEWQGRVLTFPLDDGLMRLRLRDGGNCFNLNSVADGGEGGALIADGRGMVQFARLLGLMHVNRDQRALAAALGDWVDADLMPLPGGAEDAAYLDTPYRPANTLLADLAELARVRGFDAETLRRLRGVVCVRPTTAPNLINPNTLLPDQAALLASAIADLTVEGARQIIRDRPRGGWADLEAFFNHPRLVGIGASEAMRAQFSLQTTYYVLGVEVERENGRERSAVLMQATPSNVMVLRRIMGAGAVESAL